MYICVRSNTAVIFVAQSALPKTSIDIRPGFSLCLDILSSFGLLGLFPVRDISSIALSSTTSTNKPLKIGREVLDLNIVLARLISRARSLYCIGDFAF
jgi:hypothetical protein